MNAPAAIAVPGRLRVASHDRAGMTLIELLVSLVIVSILATLSMAGLSTARTAARKAKTQATIRKISEIILPYYEQYETRRPAISNSSAVAALTNGRSYLTDAKQTAIRRLMALELPERVSDFAEAASLWNNVSPNDTLPRSYSGQVVRFLDKPPSARRYYALTRKQEPDGSFTTINATSSELLHLIVTRGPVADPDIIAHFREDEVRDTNGNGLPEFVDGWNRPIQFRRWPIGFQSPMQPIDGTLRNIEPLISNSGHRLVPLIFSAGPDGGYDIAGNLAGGADVAYGDHFYNPFEPDAPSSTLLRVAIPASAATLPGSVVLSGSSLAASGPLVFTASRIPQGGSASNRQFLTIGSEIDVDGPDENAADGILQSRDNITNHDMTR